MDFLRVVQKRYVPYHVDGHSHHFSLTQAAALPPKPGEEKVREKKGR